MKPILKKSKTRLTASRSRSKLSRITPNQILAALREMVKGNVKISAVAKALTESGVNYADFTTGSKVYIACGIGAGYRGTLKEVNGMYATVAGSMGNFWFCPVVFLQHDENPPKG